MLLQRGLFNAIWKEGFMLHKINKKHIGIICLILVLGFLLWYKYPVKVPEYQAGKTKVNFELYKITNGDSTLIKTNTENENESKKLIDIIKNRRFYKKLIQPYAVQSFTEDTIEINIYINTIGEDNMGTDFKLDVINNGDVSINYKDYGIGLPGNKQELQLYNELYEFYQYILNSNEWQTQAHKPQPPN